MKFLDKINSSLQLKHFSRSDLLTLAEEMSNTIIEVVSKNGDHLASNLGTVELTIALHYVFNAPEDKIIWDVGHQAGDLKKDLIIILNDNNMSISPNVGALSSFLSRKFSAKKFQNLLKNFGDFLKGLPKFGGNVYQIAKRFKESFKTFVTPGIAEQHAVTFAAGLALEGFKPVVAIYSTFLQRAYDQILHDVCIDSLPVVFAIDRGGIVGEDGPTHQGLFDLSYLRSLPNMVVMVPMDEKELGHMLRDVEKNNSPILLVFWSVFCVALKGTDNEYAPLNAS